MNNFIRAVAAAQLLLISPAVLFMAALVVRNQPLPYESAHAAQRVVMWYAARQWTLWVLLIIPWRLATRARVVVLWLELRS